jgi:protein involved in polysaccharide export with SLBB domain
MKLSEAISSAELVKNVKKLKVIVYRKLHENIQVNPQNNESKTFGYKLRRYHNGSYLLPTTQSQQVHSSPSLLTNRFQPTQEDMRNTSINYKSQQVEPEYYGSTPLPISYRSQHVQNSLFSCSVTSSTDNQIRQLQGSSYYSTPPTNNQYNQQVQRDEPIISVFLYDLLMQKNPDLDIPLQPGDRVVIQKIKPEELVEKVTVAGYVKHPGVFRVDEKTTLYDVLKAAGGFKEGAYPQGIVVLRKSVKEMQKERIARAISLMRQELEKEEAGVMQSDLTQDELRVRQSAFEAKRRLLEEIEKAQVTGRISGIVVPYDLEKLKNSPYNILLEDGDKIYIPKKPGSVLVFGEIYNPSALVYVKGMTVRDYLSMAGGLTKDADKENIFVIKADGSVVSSSNLNRGKDWNGRNLPEWGRPEEYSTNVLDYKLMPGDAIVVPTEVHVPTMWRPLIKDVMQIIYQGAITIYTITKL